MFENRADDQNCTIGYFLFAVNVASRVKNPPDLLLASRYERYEASLCIFNIMSDASYRSFASG
jgi:hypothetical protein